MPFSLLPKVILPEVTDISAEFLRSKGVRLLMLDFDNTIIPYTTNVPTEAVVVNTEKISYSPASVRVSKRITGCAL